MEEMAKASPREDFKLIYGAIKRPGADQAAGVAGE